MSLYYFFAVFLLTFIHLAPTCLGNSNDGLVAELSPARFPTRRRGPAASFDGNDSIYLFGGYFYDYPCGGCFNYYDQIHKYNISSESLTLAARLPTGLYGGTAIKDSVGNIYHFNGGTRSGRSQIVYKFNPITNQVTNVGELPLEMSNAVKVNDSVVLLFGQTFLDHSSIVKFDLERYESTIVGDLGHNCTRADGIRYKDDLWILCTSNLNPTRTTMLRYGLSDGTAVAVKGFPYLPETPNLIWDEDSTLYIFGGQQYPGNFIIKYDLEKPSDLHFVEVKMYPGNATYYYTGMGGAYVNKLNRIYLFGGLVNTPLFTGFKNDIWHIDLPRKEVPFQIDCSGQDGKIYPHPNNCSQYVVCLSEEIFEVNCGPGEMFDPVDLICKQQDLVDCSANCVGKTRGIYPKVGNCSQFVTCDAGETTVNHCPNNLLFDKYWLRCNFEDKVKC